MCSCFSVKQQYAQHRNAGKNPAKTPARIERLIANIPLIERWAFLGVKQIDESWGKEISRNPKEVGKYCHEIRHTFNIRVWSQIDQIVHENSVLGVAILIKSENDNVN